MMKKRMLGVIAVLLVCIFALSACKKEAGKPVDNAVSEDTTDDSEDTDQTDDAGKYKFGFSVIDMQNPYFITLEEAVQQVVDKEECTMVVKDPSSDADTQAEQIQEMIDEGINAIFLCPVDWEKITPALQACQEAGVAVINVDTDVKEQEYVASVIQSDNYQAGVQCAKDMMSKMDSARIVVMNHYNIKSTTLRVQGFLDTIESHPQYQVVKEVKTTSELEVAMKKMKQILKTDLEFDVVLGGNDPTALGALAALQLNHVKNRVLIYGIDGSPDAKTMIQQGYLEGTSAQRPIEIGRTAAETAYAYLRGEQIDKNITVDVTLITRDNLSEFDMDGWQ